MPKPASRVSIFVVWVGWSATDVIYRACVSLGITRGERALDRALLWFEVRRWKQSLRS